GSAAAGPAAAGAPPGGGFLLAPAEAGAVATPERLSPEHREIFRAVAAFVEREVVPRRARVEARDYAAHRELLELIGREGFLGIDVPEAYGGGGLDLTSAVVAIDGLGEAGSFSVTYGAHTGIGTLPLVFFGSEEQRRRYLPGLVAGTTVGAYALTEPEAGSDALGIRTRATPEPDGGYRLDGRKQFITNAGFADLFTLYAKVDGERFTAFLVERATPGLSVGPEERKLGLEGSSTCAVVLDGARVPAGSVLGEVGEGHRVAFNVLNVGRFKLAAACLARMRPALRWGAGYAKDRRAFGRPIASFPLVAQKLARMATATYAVESLVYRLAGLIDRRLREAEEAGSAEAIRTALEEYAVECSAAKVLASEELGVVMDELVQVHGGYGFIEDLPVAAHYRGTRVDRIWEGTNEINRLLISGTLLRRAQRGRLDLLGAARRAWDSLLEPEPGAAPEGPLAAERALADGVRRLGLVLAGAAARRFGEALEEEQEVLAGLADLAIHLLAMEGAVVRAEQAGAEDPARAQVHLDLARAVVASHVGPAELTARALVARVAEGDDARLLRTGIRRLLRTEAPDAIAVGRRVAEAVLAADGYPLDL
ncbi:MAG TPA: acyl-CoA dehydrogenase family protein, partial [Actinomycetota bacterium]|nr:acyl-CoA dehydrogenase family protein [Actinomycetota bacterium]